MDHFRIPSLDILARTITGDDYDHWRAYCELEGPLGSTRLDVLAGSICQLMAACHGNKGTIKEYMVNWNPAPADPVARLWSFFEGIAQRQAK